MRSSSIFSLATVCAILSLTGLSAADIPTMINYQGYIEADGSPFVGTGLFKFAIVNSAGSETYWSNDGTSSSGSEPGSAVSVSVSAGIYNVKLGDSGLINMASIPASVFTNTDVYLRVWFDDGTKGSQQLSPDSQITSAAYSYKSSDRPATVVVATDGTADYTTIQSGINALPSGGGSVYIREGTYNISSSIEVPSNVSLIGSGMATIIYLANNSNTDVIVNADQTNGNSNIAIANIQINGNNGNNGPSGHGIYFNMVDSSKIKNCWIHDCVLTGILLFECDDNIVINNQCYDNSATGIKFDSNTNYSIVSANNCRNNSSHGVWIANSNCSSNLVNGNIIRNNSGGSQFRDDGTGTVSGNNVEI